MKWTDELDGEFNGNPCKIRVGVSETYSESAVLKLTKMVLNINENNTVDFDINGGHIQEWTNYPTTVLKFDKVSKAVHPTQKPVTLLEYLIKTYTNENETVLDLAREIIGDDYVC